MQEFVTLSRIKLFVKFDDDFTINKFYRLNAQCCYGLLELPFFETTNFSTYRRVKHGNGTLGFFWSFNFTNISFCIRIWSELHVISSRRIVGKYELVHLPGWRSNQNVLDNWCGHDFIALLPVVSVYGVVHATRPIKQTCVTSVLKF